MEMMLILQCDNVAGDEMIKMSTTLMLGFKFTYRLIVEQQYGIFGYCLDSSWKVLVSNAF